MDIKSLLNMTANLAVPYRSEVVNIEYRCEKITPTYQAQLRKLADGEAEQKPDSEDVEQKPDSEDAKLLSELLVGWDITDGPNLYPPTFDNLIVLSIPFLATLARAILNDLVNPTHGSAPTS